MPSQQLPFVCTKTTVTTDDLEEFTEPVYDQVLQEQIAASEMTENIAEIPVVQEQVKDRWAAAGAVGGRSGGRRGGWRRVRHSAVEPPIPGCVVLVQEPEAHDNTTTRYLLKKALQRKEEEESREGGGGGRVARYPATAQDAGAAGPAS